MIEPIPKPCTMRVKISCQASVTAPESRDPKVNSPIAPIKSFFESYISASLPDTGVATVEASIMAVTIQVY